MQAAQIDPSKTYALKIHEGKNTAITEARSYVARFKVHQVESLCRRRKLKPTSADYIHNVFGQIDQRDVPPDLLPPEGEERRKYLARTVDPAEIEDEYEKYQELVARAAAEKAASEAEQARRTKNAQDLVALFYQFTGLNPGEKKYEMPFQVSYNGGIGINHVGVEMLFKVLTPHQPAVDKAS